MPVDARHARAQLLGGHALHVVDAAGGLGETGRHIGRARQHHLARSDVGGAAGHLGQRVEELRRGVADALLAQREHVL
jgi:hypothetical protein